MDANVIIFNVNGPLVKDRAVKNYIGPDMKSEHPFRPFNSLVRDREEPLIKDSITAKKVISLL